MIHLHRPKLIDFEYLTILPNPILLEYYRPVRHAELDKDSHDGKDGAQKKEAEDGEEFVKKGFHSE